MFTLKLLHEQGVLDKPHLDMALAHFALDALRYFDKYDSEALRPYIIFQVRMRVRGLAHHLPGVRVRGRDRIHHLPGAPCESSSLLRSATPTYRTTATTLRPPCFVWRRSTRTRSTRRPASSLATRCVCAVCTRYTHMHVHVHCTHTGCTLHPSRVHRPPTLQESGRPNPNPNPYT